MILSLILTVGLVAGVAHGQEKVRVQAVEESPFINVAKDGKIFGYLIDILDELKARMGFDYELMVREDGEYGTLQDDGSYNGLVGALMAGEADIALAPLSISSERSLVIDFSSPYMEVQISMITRRPEKGKQVNFDNIQNMVATSRQYGTLKNGVVKDFFKKSDYRLYTEMLEVMENDFGDNAYSDSTAEAMEKVVSEDYVFMEESPFATFAASRNCSVMIVEAGIPIASYGLGLQKGSKLRAQINPELLALKEDGTMDKLWDKWWRSQARCKTPKICMCREYTDDPTGGQASNLVYGANLNTFGSGDNYLKAVMHKDGFPFSYRPNYLAKWQGYSVDVINAIGNSLGYRFTPNTVNAWGVPQDDGTFDGMIGELERYQSQIALGPFTVPKSSNDANKLFLERLQVVDFSSPIMKDVKIAMLTQRPAEGKSLSFENVKELLGKGGKDMKIYVVKESFVDDFIQTSDNNQMKKLASRIPDSQKVANVEEGVAKVAEDANVVYLDEAPFTAAYAAKDCKLISVDTEVVLGDYSYGLVKDAAFKEQVDKEILNMEKDSSLRGLFKYHWFSACPQYVTKKEATKITLSLG